MSPPPSMDKVPDELPIDACLPEIVAALRSKPAVVVEAPPGAGKTTRVPRALLDAGFAPIGSGEIVVLQPRRLPARLGAARVAAELGESPGGQGQVGYTVRFEDVSGPRTRIRFVTEGVLNRRLLADPTLAGIAVVVLDEFHERHLAADVALALLRRLQNTRRPDLKLCVMSATLDADPLVEYLDQCPRVRSEGRRFVVRIEHLPQPDDRPLDVQVTGAVRHILRQEPDGDLLVFLPGNAEIRRCEAALATVAQSSNLLLLPLHGDLPLVEQARVVAPSPRRKVILSTNVAETSVTIEGVVAVIDSGLARMASHSQWTGLPTLALGKISQASANQRAGRAGRTRAGVALRLYTRADFDARPAHDVPEIGRSDLTEVLLALLAAGITDLDSFSWLTPPPIAAVNAARELLERLGAVDHDSAGQGRLSERGRRMLRFPAHPRLARLMVEGEDRGVGPDAAALAALLAERDIREGSGRSGRSSAGSKGHAQSRHQLDDGIDAIALLELFEAARAARFSHDRLRALGLDPRSTAIAEQARLQFAKQMRTDRRGSCTAPPATRVEMDRALCRAALTGFSDRVARRRESGARTVVLAAGGTAELAYEPDSDYIVALDAEERSARRPGSPPDGGAAGRPGATIVRLGCGIDPDWLGDLENDDLRASDTLQFDEATERVVERSRLSYRSLTLEESARPAASSDEVSGILAQAALARGAAAFDEPGALPTLAARLAVLAATEPAATYPALDEEGVNDLLRGACQGLRSFADLRAVGLTARLTASWDSRLRARLANEAPLTVTLPGGRAVPVNYQVDQPPWIESRLQDFFGMAKGPAIAGGRLPLTLHLLAPNGRAVQVTRDLDSFWRQHYPALRRELGRRYPRHSWPEDGRTATPPPPLPPRRRQR